jgi:hypothetical protein
MKYILLIPDGVGIRNFLCGSLIDLLLENGEVVIWHRLPPESIIPFQERWRGRLSWQQLPNFRESPLACITRQAKVYAQLYWHADHIMLKRLRNFQQKSVRWQSKLIDRIARVLGRVFGSENGVLWLDRQHAAAAIKAAYFSPFEEFLKNEKPDIIFCTHQRASVAVPAMLAARKLEIPSATFVYSWDNLPKGRMAVHADHFLVWSEVMKDESVLYYPEVPIEHIHIVGTPQFEHHFNPLLVKPRDEFLADLGFDARRPVICFSGSDVTTSPDDPQFLGDLAIALRKIEASRRPQILFRRSPVDISGRFDSILVKFPEIIVSEPLWQADVGGDWTQIVPLLEDVILLTNIVHHCDLVLNFGSTMALDFAILDKPAIYFRYETEQRKGWSVDDFYQFTHFRFIRQIHPVYWAKNPDELTDLVKRAISNPGDIQAARTTWARKQVQYPLMDASERIFQSLETIAARGSL